MTENLSSGKDPIPELMPVRMLSEYSYCPRLGVLMWAENLFEDNEYTVEGRVVHRRVDRGKGKLPIPAPNPSKQDDDDSPADDSPMETIHARSVFLSSPALRLTSRLDLVEATGDLATPVEYKRGAQPDLPEGAWPSDRIQLCAQGLLLREHGYTCNEGVLYYHASRSRVPVVFDDALIRETLRTREAFFAAVGQKRLPPPLEESRKCQGCSLAGICLPDEVNLLSLADAFPPSASGSPPASLQEPASSPDTCPLTEADMDSLEPWVEYEHQQDEELRLVFDPKFRAEHPELLARPASPLPISEESPVRRLWPARDDDVPLIVQNPRARISKEGERLVVHEGKAKLADAKLMCTSCVVIYGTAQITTPAMHACLDYGIPVMFLTTGGWYLGHATGPGPKNATAMEAQFAAAADPERCLRLSRRIVHAKIHNCRTLLRRNSLSSPADALDVLSQMARRAREAESLQELLGIEGAAARAYFGAFCGMFKTPPETWPFSMEGRNRRPPRDPVNALLSYAYGMLVREWVKAILAANLNPYHGFYHQPRFGRPALALDLMEEFRPLAADSTVITAINTGVIKPEDFTVVSGAYALSESARKAFIEAFDRRMETLVTHPVFDYRLSLRRVLETQARLLVRHLQGEIPAYPEFLTR